MLLRRLRAGLHGSLIHRSSPTLLVQRRGRTAIVREDPSQVIYDTIKASDVPPRWSDLESSDALSKLDKQARPMAIVSTLHRKRDSDLLKGYIDFKGGLQKNHPLIAVLYMSSCDDPEEISRVWKLVKPDLPKANLTTANYYTLCEAVARTPLWEEALQFLSPSLMKMEWSAKRLFVARMLEANRLDDALSVYREHAGGFDCLDRIFSQCLQSREDVGRLLTFISEYDLYIDSTFAKSPLWSTHFEAGHASSKRGLCTRCQTPMRNFRRFSDTDWTDLLSLTENVLIKRSLLGCTLTDVQNLDHFLEGKKFDVVVDCLNLAFIRGSLKYVFDLCERFGLKVLLVTRKHLASAELTKKRHYDFDIFYTDNYTSDDLMVIWASMLIGQECKIISCDMYRDARSKMTTSYIRKELPTLIERDPDRTMKIIKMFNIWYNRSLFNPQGLDLIQEPGIEPRAFKQSDRWHVPVFSSKYSHEWLCLKNK